jgi:hypothetical protein
MGVPVYFRKLARRCLGLSQTAVEPEVVEQMQVWAVELADEADRAERRDRRIRTVREKWRGRLLKRSV